jgi:hypothetical protein
MNKIEPVKLNDEEQALFDAICWDLDELCKKDYDTRVEMLDKMGQLTELLLDRQAVPRVRVEYFTNPEMNAGGRGKSKQQVFEQNGTAGKHIVRDPNFMAYLRYFIYGPDLPKQTISGFGTIIEDDAGLRGWYSIRSRSSSGRRCGARAWTPAMQPRSSSN